LIIAALAGAVAIAGFQSRTAAQRMSVLHIQPTTLADVRTWDTELTARERAGDLRLRETRDDVLVAGRVHERFDQLFRGVRVLGGDLTRQSDRGLSVSLFGVLYDGLDLDVAPTLSADDARARVAALTGVAPGTRPELVILPLDDGSYALTYRCQVVTTELAAAYFIDAHDGRVRLTHSLIETQSAVVSGTGVLLDTKKVSVMAQTGTYLADDQLRPPSLRTFDLGGNYPRTVDVLNGVTTPGVADLATDPGTTWSDGPNVDAHVYEGYTYDYYFKRFGRRGLDNQDARIQGITHPVRLQDYATASDNVFGTFYLNAFYCPGCGSDGKGMMVYGVGLPSNIGLRVGSSIVTFKNFAGALDVVAHELTHGVTAFTSGLGGSNEPGALNEAFSDMMGTSVEFFFQPLGSGPLKADYTIAEDIVSQPVAGLVRSLQDPQSLGTPDNYSKRLTDAVDNGEVHANSTIASHAFYLAIEGGTNRTSGLSVQGVGAANRDQIEKVFYRAFTSLLPSSATFSIARAATIQAARDLYGVGSPPERAVTQAWTAVGVS
jgi:thermolysin